MFIIRQNKQKRVFFFVYLANLTKQGGFVIIRSPKKKRMYAGMIVCAHGDVAEFCEKHDMVIFERYRGCLDDYKGSCPVVVTNCLMTREEYDSLKCKLFGRGVELVSTLWTDDELIVRLLRKSLEDRKKRGGRQMFGYRKVNGVIEEIPELMVVARRVIELRDAGMTLMDIRSDPEVRWRSGRMLGKSTIQKIIENREVYENG